MKDSYGFIWDTALCFKLGKVQQKKADVKLYLFNWHPFNCIKKFSLTEGTLKSCSYKVRRSPWKWPWRFILTPYLTQIAKNDPKSPQVKKVWCREVIHKLNYASSSDLTKSQTVCHSQVMEQHFLYCDQFPRFHTCHTVDGTRDCPPKSPGIHGSSRYFHDIGLSESAFLANLFSMFH